MTDHDSIYHRLFRHAGMVAALVREFVREPWIADLDLDGIARENVKLHADSGERRDGDTAWRIPRRGGGATYILVMLEFQSTIDRWMALRVLVYAGLLWQHLEEKDRLPPDGGLPPILPIVLYNGGDHDGAHWTAPLSLNELIGLTEGSPLWKWQPAIRYYIIDESRYDDADLAKREGLLPLLFRLENAADSGHLLVVTDALSAWFEVHPPPDELRLLFLEVLQGAIASLAPGTQVPDNLLGIRKMLAARAATWRQEARQEGRQEGEKIGERKGEAAFLFGCWSGGLGFCRRGCANGWALRRPTSWRSGGCGCWRRGASMRCLHRAGRKVSLAAGGTVLLSYQGIRWG